MVKLLKPITLFVILTIMLSACGKTVQPPTATPTKEVVVPTAEPTKASTPTVPPTEAPKPPTPTVPPTEAPKPPTETAKPPAPAGVEGMYSYAGKNLDGSSYEGVFEVVASGDAFKWNWNNGEALGVGLKQDDVLSVATGGDACYLVSYIIEDSGVINGIWTDMALSGIGTDIDTPTEDKAKGLEGLYNVTGKNPDGSDYGCSLQVTKKGDVYEWYWFSCGEYTGVGVVNGKTVTVAYGADTCKAFSYHIEADGSLKGIWSIVGGTTLGTEDATRK